MTPLTPPVLQALATIRAAVRTNRGQDLGTLPQILLSLALYALCESFPESREGPDLVQPFKVSQAGRGNGCEAQTVHERWITAKDASSRLGISLRTLRRRATSRPYAAFCIPQPRGFKVSESRLDEFMRRAR